MGLALLFTVAGVIGLLVVLALAVDGARLWLIRLVGVRGELVS